jgi:predicted enzyme related to lactoylglutathione lyase
MSKRRLVFCRELFGWQVEKTTSPMGDYYIGKLGERQVGGLMGVPEHEAMGPIWTTFVYVQDVDDIVEHVAAAGGSLLEKPFDLPDGRIAVVADSGGAMFGVISGPPPEGTWLSREPGSVCWLELLTRDVTRAEAFYAQVFDWKAETRSHGATKYTTFSHDGEP